MQGEKPELKADEQRHHDRMKKAGRAKACPQCRGRRGWKINRQFVWCTRCDGSGRLKETGGMKDSRVSKSDAIRLTAGDVATLLIGLPQHKVDAALAHVNDDPDAVLRLTEYMKDRVAKSTLSIAAKCEVTEHKIDTLAALIVMELNRKPGSFLKTGDACHKMDCRRQEWLIYWEIRLWDFTGECNAWLTDVSIHMAKRHREKRENTAA